jgi:hypothetical protein
VQGTGRCCIRTARGWRAAETHVEAVHACRHCERGVLLLVLVLVVRRAACLLCGVWRRRSVFMGAVSVSYNMLLSKSVALAWLLVVPHSCASSVLAPSRSLVGTGRDASRAELSVALERRKRKPGSKACLGMGAEPEASLSWAPSSKLCRCAQTESTRLGRSSSGD